MKSHREFLSFLKNVDQAITGTAVVNILEESYGSLVAKNLGEELISPMLEHCPYLLNKAGTPG
jgi:hypothetical protein